MEVIYKQTPAYPGIKEWYMNTFLDGYTYRQSCYQCQYACPERCSDITIGDFWGLGKYQSVEEILPHESGCSVILPITSKGEELLDCVSPKMNLYSRPVKEVIEGNDQLRAPMYLSRRKKAFRYMYPYFGKNAYYMAIIDKLIKHRLRTITYKLLSL